MKDETETVALLLGEQSDDRWQPQELAEGAVRIVRDAEGTIKLEKISSEEEFEAASSSSGCFRRGTPIIDPETREVIGYEMEEVPSLKNGTEI
jgi:hypothetical protein